MRQGSILLPWRAVEAYLSAILRRGSVTVTEASDGRAWEFQVAIYDPPGKNVHQIHLSVTREFLAHHRLVSSDVIALSSGPVR